MNEIIEAVKLGVVGSFGATTCIYLARMVGLV